MPEHEKCDCGHYCDDPQICDDCGKSFCDDCWADHHVEVVVDSEGKPVRVELHDAFTWDCDACGRENIHRCFHSEDLAPSEEEQNDVKRAMGLEPWDDLPEGTFVAVPTDVQCNYCGSRFLATPPPNITFLEDDDEDDNLD